MRIVPTYLQSELTFNLDDYGKKVSIKVYRLQDGTSTPVRIDCCALFVISFWSTSLNFLKNPRQT
jgi:hypothetical protein